jgi:hypothetical protein
VSLFFVAITRVARSLKCMNIPPLPSSSPCCITDTASSTSVFGSTAVGMCGRCSLISLTISPSPLVWKIKFSAYMVVSRRRLTLSTTFANLIECRRCLTRVPCATFSGLIQTTGKAGESLRGTNPQLPLSISTPSSLQRRWIHLRLRHL